jgi:hypothetical protein
MITWLEQNPVLIGHGLTIFGLICGAIGIAWQLARQHRSTLQLQRENAREKLKLQIYETLVQKMRRLSHAKSTVAVYADMIPFNVEILPPPTERAAEFSRLHYEWNGALVELIEEFEAWSIAFPGLQVFQDALNSAHHDAVEAYTPLFSYLLRGLPLDPPVESYKRAMDDVGSYIHDLTIEAQNVLLAGLFESRVPRRQPLDPRYKVITTEPDKAAELLRYFNSETSWGKAKAVAEAQVKISCQAPPEP